MKTKVPWLLPVSDITPRFGPYQRSYYSVMSDTWSEECKINVPGDNWLVVGLVYDAPFILDFHTYLTS